MEPLMDSLAGLGAFHFLRPWWFLALPLALLIAWRALRATNPLEVWQGLIAQPLLDALILPATAEQGRLRPSRLMGPVLVIAVVALAGPAWERQPTPFAEDQAAVFFVVKVTPSMLAQDIQPSRLERTVQKINDYLELKPGQRTGLIAYAGTAHLAMPLTRDPEVIMTFATALTPDAMPVPGDELPAALSFAQARLDRAGVPGSIVVFADDTIPEHVSDISSWREDSDSGGMAPVHIIAMAGGPDVIPPPGSPPAAPLDESLMRDLARAGGGGYYPVTPDNQDMQSLANDVERGIRSAPGGEQDQWRDMGYWLLPLLAILLLPFFRRGGAVLIE